MNVLEKIKTTTDFYKERKNIITASDFAQALGKGKFGFLSTLNFVRKMGFIVPIGLMMRSKNILGVNMLKLADNKPHVLTDCLKNVVELLQQQQIQPIVGGEYTADTFFEAQDALESGKSTGKLIVKWN